MRMIPHFLCISLMLNLYTAFGMETKVVAEPERTYQDIKQTLGIVPGFLKAYPADAIPGAWMDMKNLQLNPKTVLSGRDKELIGLAVSAQIPCRFCTYFHTQAAKMNQATTQEIKEAIAIAAVSRRWSTFIQGTQTDLNLFKKEADQMLEFSLKRANLQAMEEKPVAPIKTLMTAADAYQDIKITFGFVPTFLKNYPESSIAGAWQEIKAIEMNPATALTGKTKDLIGLAVSAQIPCPYCIYYHTKSAMLQGATSSEINEAIAMAGITRNWSTVLNGNYTDEKVFETETNQIIQFVKSKIKKEVTVR